MAPFIGSAIATPLYLLFINNLSTADDTATLALFVAELAVSNTFLVTFDWDVRMFADAHCFLA